MRAYLFAILLVVASIHGSPVNAQQRSQEHQLWRAWTNMWDCTRESSYRDDFGIRWPYVQRARQEAYVEVYARVNGSAAVFDQIVQTGQACAAIAAGTAGLAGYATGGAAAWKAFQGTFAQCMRDANLVGAITSLRIASGSRCMW